MRLSRVASVADGFYSLDEAPGPSQRRERHEEAIQIGQARLQHPRSLSRKGWIADGMSCLTTEANETSVPAGARLLRRCREQLILHRAWREKGVPALSAWAGSPPPMRSLLPRMAV